MTNKNYDSVELQASYGVGRQMGEQLAANPFEGLDVHAVMDGFQDALTAQESRVSIEEIQVAFTEINQRMQQAAAEQAQKLAAEGEVFLAENAKREEIQVTDSGLQYEVLEEGEGEIPTLESTVRTHYHGTLINGDTFDSSYDRGQPAEFPVQGVIKGWTEALQLMKTGSKWRLYIPSHLAYGEQGAGGRIGPNATLIFDIELLDIL
ncbi:FKBP-type peptidyl-prolyl cis-trans isomerase [Algicola sagamiensis]|uniref:FKBP-type peptidyl-prolyl cis-trans isomerase n=1 Tax=Algicola sagamiensis TaxID=163869 RepID=UPI000375A9EB|nr:FKBP-type peptidyl-prolyl cis-trans isomerase [Algicola sagamiensis]